MKKNQILKDEIKKKSIIKKDPKQKIKIKIKRIKIKIKNKLEGNYIIFIEW
jgi:hypothetical protein